MKVSYAALAVACFALIALTGVSAAGPLDPPGGPITPTYKPLSELEPRIAISAANTPGDADSLFKITTAGSYYFAGNITGVAGKHGIEVALGGGNGAVNIDLMGFTLKGVPGSLNGWAPGNGQYNLALTNGTVQGWGGHGVSVGTNSLVHLQDLTLTLNGGWGVATGGALRLRNCTVLMNVQGGIDAGGDVDLSDLAILLNGGPALLADTGNHRIASTRIVADGLVNSAPLVSLNGGGVADGLSMKVSNSTFTETVVRGRTTNFSMTLSADGITANSLVENIAPNEIRATNCTLSTAVVNLTDDGLILFLREVATFGTTNAPTLVRMLGSTCMLKADRLANGNTLATGMVLLDISGSANRVHSTTLATLANGNTLVRVAGAVANGNTIEDCRLVASGTGASTAIQLSSNNNLVRRNEAVRLMGGTFIDNQGANNAVGPVVTAANILTSNNPHANVAH